jgi:cell division control protein 7
MGLLVDFGLAQEQPANKPEKKVDNKTAGRRAAGFVPNDQRPNIRASRAGTRGFRAPEVLLKIVNQTTGT